METCENRKQQRTLNRRAFACAVFRRKRQVVACAWTNVPSSGRRSGLNRQTKGIEVKQAKNIKIRISIRLDSKRQPPAGFFFVETPSPSRPALFVESLLANVGKLKLLPARLLVEATLVFGKTLKSPAEPANHACALFRCSGGLFPALALRFQEAYSCTCRKRGHSCSPRKAASALDRSDFICL